MTKYEFLNKYAETVRVEEDELEKYEDDSEWWLVGEVQSSKNDDPTPEVESEELAHGVQALRERSQKHGGSEVWEQKADELEEEHNLSSSDSESSGSIREGESWSEYRSRLAGTEVEGGKSRTKREIEDLQNAARWRKQRGGNSTAFNEWIEERTSEILESDEVDDSQHPSEKFRGEQIKYENTDTEVLEAAKAAFQDRANAPDGANSWASIADELEQKSSGVETEVFPDLDDTKVTHHTDGSATIKTSHSRLREELQGLLVYGDDDDPVCHQISDVDGELTVELDDPDKAIDELERVM